jgi:hypothetical protein
VKIILSVFINIVLSVSVNAEILKEGYFAIVYTKADVLADLKINGIPVITMDKMDFYSGQLEVNNWISPGKNIITINLDEQKKKNENSFYNPKFRVAVYIASKGQFPSDGKMVFEYEWPENLTDDEKKSGSEKQQFYPVSRTIEFVPEFVPPSEIWEKSEEVNMIQNDEKEIIKLLENFETAFNKRDYEKLYSILEFRAIDSTKSRYYPATKEKVMSDIKSFSYSNSIKIKNVSGGKYIFTKLYNGKIYHVAGLKGKAPLAYVSNDGSGEIEIYVSKINGKWVISR